MTFLKSFKILIFTFTLALFGYQSSWAAQADFSWTPNSEADGTTGYKLYYGTSSREYTESVDVGSPVPLNGLVNASITELTPGQTYFFTVVAYNADGDESDYANEVVHTISNDDIETNTYDIYVSTTANLSDAITLDGATGEGNFYVFTSPDTGVSNVTFSVDGNVEITEWLAPYELAGGAAYNTSQLSPGTHEINADIRLSDGSSQVVSATFTVTSDGNDTGNNVLHDIYFSESSNLSEADLLEGATVSGDVYVFTGPDTDVSKVTFSVDGVVAISERYAPFELVGGAAYDTSELSPGEHEILASFELSDGSLEIVSAIFTVPSNSEDLDNNNSPYSLLFSETSYLSEATYLDGATVDGDIYVFTGPDTDVSKVTFSVDGVVAITERYAPFELVGGAAFNTSQLSSGTHEITASITRSDGSSDLIGAEITVQ